MKRHTKFFATTAIVTMATALPALALTPEEAWDNWVATTANFPGLEVTYDDPTSKNGGLSVADLQIQANEGDDVFTLTVPEFLIMEDGADAVTMTLPEDATVSMLVDGISMKFTLWNDDLVIGASDENGTVSNSISASAITFTLTEMMEGDTALDAKGGIEVKDLDFKTTSDGMRSESAFSYDEVTGSAEAVSLKGDKTIGLNFALDASQTLLTVNGLDTTSEPSLATALRDGFSMQMRNASAGGRYQFMGAGNMEMNSDMTWGESEFGLTLDPTGLNLSGTSVDMTSRTVNPDITFGLTIPKVEMGVSIPLLKSDEPQTASLLIGYYDMLPDMEAGMAPPVIADMVNQPITFLVDAEADVILKQDLVDERAVSAAAQMNPLAMGDVTAIRLNDLNLSGAGSAALASGAFDLPGGIMAANPSNIPEGELSVELKKIPELVEVLQTMGMMTPDMGMGLMMMQGMAKEGPDGSMLFDLSTKDGAVTVNGNRIK